LLSNEHGGFGKRPEETDRPKCRHRASGRLRGDKDNFEIDRQAVGAITAAIGTRAAVDVPRENRRFLQRGTRWLTHFGIDQFLDIGTGLPTAGNVHEIAQEVNSAVRSSTWTMTVSSRVVHTVSKARGGFTRRSPNMRNPRLQGARNCKQAGRACRVTPRPQDGRCDQVIAHSQVVLSSELLAK
jgi:hypothetical protein